MNIIKLILTLWVVVGCYNFSCGSSDSFVNHFFVGFRSITRAHGKSLKSTSEGGHVDKLLFAIIGDLQTSFEPNFSLNVFKGLECEGPRPSFAVAVGVSLATDSTQQSEEQLAAYWSARQYFSNSVYFTLPVLPQSGNRQYSPLLMQMMNNNFRSNGLHLPYYVLKFSSFNQTWSSKLIFLAPHLWSKAQQLWLERVLAEPTTYTFVVSGSEDHPDLANILQHYPYTLQLKSGASHYRYQAIAKTLLIGHLLKKNQPIGYVIAKQQANSTIEFTAYDYRNHRVSNRFAVHPDGSSAAVGSSWQTF